MTSDTHAQITVLATACATGQMHMPLIVFPGVRFSYNPLAGFEKAHFGRFDNGWMDSEIFSHWLKTAFVPATEHLKKPVVLFADGHTTHATMAVHRICREHNIILYQLPSHSSHIVQPLDLTTFKSLKEAWYRAVRQYRFETCEVVGKREFSRVFKKAWDLGTKANVVASGFRAAGIFPWDPDHFDRTKTIPSRTTQTVTSESPTTDVDTTELQIQTETVTSEAPTTDVDTTELQVQTETVTSEAPTTDVDTTELQVQTETVTSESPTTDVDTTELQGDCTTTTRFKLPHLLFLLLQLRL